MVSRAIIGVLFVACLAACSDLTYLSQAAYGQREIALKSRSITKVVADPSTPPRIKKLLTSVESIKRFGERQGLTATASYTSYADLNRESAVWVVSACEPLHFKTKKWHFPVVGSVPYLGWFDKKDAEHLGEELAHEGWDVDVRDAAAYSTLGWFDDPVLSTMISEGDEALGELADTVLHESMHATLYVNAETHFNESIANFVGNGLAPLYLDEALGQGSREKEAFLSVEQRGEVRARALNFAYQRLDSLYGSSLLDSEKLRQKEAVLAQLKRGLGWSRPLTNATLTDFKAYHTGRAELEALFAACGSSWPRFIQSLAHHVTRASFVTSQQKDWADVIRPLLAAHCPG